MSRFILSFHAKQDLVDIRAYLETVPERYALPIAFTLKKMLHQIGSEPFFGAAHSNLTRLAASEVRSRNVKQYRIFYSMRGRIPEILGIIHTSRDLPTIMEKRLQ